MKFTESCLKQTPKRTKAQLQNTTKADVAALDYFTGWNLYCTYGLSLMPTLAYCSIHHSTSATFTNAKRCRLWNSRPELLAYSLEPCIVDLSLQRTLVITFGPLDHLVVATFSVTGRDPDNEAGKQGQNGGIQSQHSKGLQRHRRTTSSS